MTESFSDGGGDIDPLQMTQMTWVVVIQGSKLKHSWKMPGLN